MKILILGTPRSRSNYLLYALAQHHSLENLVEPYQMNYHDLSRVSDISKTLSLKTNYICKLQTTDIKPCYDEYTQNLWYESFKFHRYNKIITTSRENIVDQVASLILAVETGYWFGYYPPPIEIVFQDHHIIMVLDILQQKRTLRKICDQLKAQNITVQHLCYETIPKWLLVQGFTGNIEKTTELSNGSPVSGYDYSKVIKNYDEFRTFVNYVEKNSIINSVLSIDKIKSL